MKLASFEAFPKALSEALKKNFPNFLGFFFKFFPSKGSNNGKLIYVLKLNIPSCSTLNKIPIKGMCKIMVCKKEVM